MNNVGKKALTALLAGTMGMSLAACDWRDFVEGSSDLSSAIGGSITPSPENNPHPAPQPEPKPVDEQKEAHFDKEAFDRVYSTWSEQKEELETQLAAEQQKLNDYKQKKEENQREIQQLDKRIVALQSEKQSVEKQIADYNQQQLQNKVDAQLAYSKASLDSSLKTLEDSTKRLDAAKSTVVSAQQKVDAQQKKVTDLEKKLSAINVGISALDREINTKTAQVADLEKNATSTTTTGVASTDNFTRTDYDRIVAQATMEMINDYRVANGLHPLRTHEIYNQQADKWSQQMAADYNRTRDYNTAFRHSDAKALERSGENIIIYNSGRMPTEEDYKQLPAKLFDMWYKSDGHNSNMLQNYYSGTGMSVYTDQYGNVWATNMFFMDKTNTDRAGYYYPGDNSTARANQNPSGYYTAGGARKVLGTPSWKAPTDTRNVKDVSYNGVQGDRNTLDKTRGLPTKIDPRIKVTNQDDVDTSTQVTTLKQQIADLQKQRASKVTEYNTTRDQLADARDQLQKDAAALNTAKVTQSEAQRVVDRDKQVADAMQSQYDQAKDKITSEYVPTTPPAQQKELDRVTSDLSVTQQQRSEAVEEGSALTKQITEQSKVVDTAKNNVAEHDKKEPQKEDYITYVTVTPKAADTTVTVNNTLSDTVQAETSVSEQIITEVQTAEQDTVEVQDTEQDTADNTMN